MDTPAKRLRWAREDRTTFTSASDAARAFGWPISTYLGHENGDRTPSRESAKRYGRAYRVPWEWILEGGPLPEDKITPLQTVPILEEVAGGVWHDLDTHYVGERGASPFIVDARFPTFAQYAMIVRGSLINRVAQPDDMLHCIDLIEHLGSIKQGYLEAQTGDLVIVNRIRRQQELIEVSARRIRRLGSIIYLDPDSSDDHWKSIRLDSNDPPKDEEIEVKALAVAIYKPLRRL